MSETEDRDRLTIFSYTHKLAHITKLILESFQAVDGLIRIAMWTEGRVKHLRRFEREDTGFKGMNVEKKLDELTQIRFCRGGG
jgi:hypothetical protein